MITKKRTPDPERPAHPERICWGCSLHCAADALACGNGTIRAPHPIELFGDDWAEWSDAKASAVVFDRVSFAYDGHEILRDVSFSVPTGSMLFVLGASGAGKSVLLKLTLGLMRPDSGRILVKGQRIDTMSERDLLQLRAGIGMLFQETALFDSLTVEENIGYRLYEETDTPLDDVRRRVLRVASLVGLAGYLDRMPSELSGGERRRVALARAVAAGPSLLLIDDPTTGLDPVIATTIDDQIVTLRDLEHVTSIIVTHQIRDARYMALHRAVQRDDATAIEEGAPSAARAARFMVLHEGRIRFEGTFDDLIASTDPYLKEFLFMTLPPW